MTPRPSLNLTLSFTKKAVKACEGCSIVDFKSGGRSIEIWIGGKKQNRGFQRGGGLIGGVEPTIWEVYLT